MQEKLRCTRLVEVRGFPPIPQKSRNGWGTEMVVRTSQNSTRQVGLLELNKISGESV